jgi:Ca2+/H+ antiporter, TMEM165/GDT1 family
MEAFWASLSLVAVAEIGDKTQLLSFVLAARFRRQQVAIIMGILVATMANHLVAAYVGDWVAAWLVPEVLRWVLGLAFLGFAVWALVPDTLEDDAVGTPGRGAFVTATVLFFLAEMGDKTQLATVALGAQYASLLAVTAGTTMGMMIANVPAVLVGERLSQRFSLQNMRFVAAALFAIFGVLILIGSDLGLGLIPG